MTAVKVRLKDILNGEWVKNEGMVPSYILTPYGEQVSRLRVMGTIVSKFVSEDGNFASITLDDTTDTIRAKTFKTSSPIGAFEIGDLVDIIGKLREYNGEIYMIPESVRKITDINWEILRKLEINSNLSKFSIKKTEKSRDSDNLKSEILKLVGSEKGGIEFTEIIRKVKGPESSIEDAINILLAEGICYEARPGVIKKI
jgi:RPA family protein